MREASFLRQNEKKWRQVEQILEDRNVLTPDEAANLFVDLTDDLSYARTHYPTSVSTKYLNALTCGIYGRLNQGQKERFKRVVEFWKLEVPMAVGRQHPKFLYALIFFCVCVLIGVVSTHYDKEFPRVVLGDEYVDMTLQNIENQDPMAVYKEMDGRLMFLKITVNNLYVVCYTFMAGILFSLGAYYFLFVNGIMVGVFQYFFVQKGLFLDSFLTIWIHGAIEIPCIIIGGAAGITLGNSWLFPGSLPRKTSLVRGARDAFKILIGVLPFIIVAGFLESFLTRHTEIPHVFRAMIIFASFAFIYWYFYHYPRLLLKASAS